MTALRKRVESLEAGGAAGYTPVPEAFVLFAGPREPAAIVSALGLEDMERVQASVVARDYDPVDPPRLVDEVQYGGRCGMTAAQRSLVQTSCMAAGTGEAWTFYWERGGSGWLLDKSVPGWFREFECGARYEGS